MAMAPGFKEFLVMVADSARDQRETMSEMCLDSDPDYANHKKYLDLVADACDVFSVSIDKIIADDESEVCGE